MNGRTENEKRQSSDNLEKERDGTTVVLDRTSGRNYARGTNDKKNPESEMESGGGM